MLIILAISTFQLASIILILAFLFLLFKVLESSWSYKISKPYKWEQAENTGKISDKLKKIERSYRDKGRFYAFWFQIERLRKYDVSGVFAELGVYKGETANMIHQMDPSRKLYLFDTFSGFDNKDLNLESNKDEKYNADNFSDNNLKSVQNNIDGNENVVFCKGYFPDTLIDFPEEKYAFVHLDADLYRPTIAALNYFYHRLSPGGIIIIHDYNNTWDGIPKALDEFSASIPETIMEVADWQGSALIVKNNLIK